MKFSTNQLIPLTELQRAPGRVMEKLRGSKDPLLILDRGRPAALLLDHAQYEKMLSQRGPKEGGTERKQTLLAALEQMLPIVIKGYQPEKVILFGSLAKDRVTEDSDIDLCIIKKTSKRSLDRQKELVRRVRPTVATDFFVYTPEEIKKGLEEKPAFFQKEIIEEGKILYEKTA